MPIESLGSAEIAAQVYLPPGYNDKPEQVYPVLYLLHGQGDSENSWITKGGVEGLANGLIATKQIAPLVIVMPYGFLKSEDQDISGKKYNRPSPEAFKHRLAEQIAPLIEKKYRVQKSRAGRAIAGSSMGSEQALDFVFRNPEWASSLGCFSPACPREPFDEANILQRWPALAQPDHFPFNLCYFAWGSEETAAQPGLPGPKYQPIVDRLKQSKLEVSLGGPFNGKHRWDSPEPGPGCLWAQCLRDFLLRLKWANHTPKPDTTAGP
jgi:S-formylglutathione hydrolase FrmB